MSIYQVDPIRDPRWPLLLERHPGASVFDSPGWLKALRDTYGHQPRVLTTSPPAAELTNGLLVCSLHSWLAGSRLVSLPFSDHCEPLVDRPEELGEILSSLVGTAKNNDWNYIEIRPRDSILLATAHAHGFRPSRVCCGHTLDISPGLQQLFSRFHKSCVQRKIRKAEREGLTYEEGRSERLLRSFYRLLRLTRRRHGVPPQPFAWFRNLIASLGENVKIHVAAKDGQPIASILTLSFKKSFVYKYGGSDARFHNLGGMPFILWKAIQGAKQSGLEEFDLGRSYVENKGLIAFKEHLGAARSELTYCRFSASGNGTDEDTWKLRAAKQFVALMPDPVLDLAGRLLYKHFA